MVDEWWVHHDERRAHRIRIALVVAFVLLLAAVLVLLAMHGRTLLAHLADGRLVQRQAERLGPFAPVVCIGIVVLQQLSAIIPAEPVELAAGYAFGFWQGALVCLVGRVLGTLAIVGVARGAGDRLLRVLVSSRRVVQLERFGNSPRFELLVFLCFLVPGLPKDVMTYAAALANMPIRHLVPVTTVGRIPSIVSSTLAAGSFGSGNYLVTGVTVVATAVLAIGGAAAYRQMAKRKQNQTTKDSDF